MRRQPTAEQKQKAAERRERFTALVAQVAAMDDSARAAIVARVGAIVTCEGRALTPLNSCLILSQCPGATMVGGFHQWKTHGRQVKKGASGLSLWIPTSRTTKGEDDAPPAGEGTEKRRAGFIMGTVFDVTQTEPIGELATV